MSPWGPVEGMVYELRTAGDPLAYVHAVRELVRQADERLPISGVNTQSALIDETINQEIAFARLCSLFAVLALAIACVGLYGAMSYNVARRHGEIGIRMALGAQRGGVVWLVLREVLMLAAAGLAISVPAALAASKLIQSFLFDTKPERSCGIDRGRGDPGERGGSCRLSPRPQCFANRPIKPSGTSDAGLKQNGRPRGGGGSPGPANLRSAAQTARYMVLPWRFTSRRVSSFEPAIACSKSEVFFTALRLTS